MDADSFADLALRVLAREATDEERRALDAAIAADPARGEEFRQLEETHALLLAAAPMAIAAEAQEPALPAYRLNELRTAVRQHFGPVAARVPIAASPSRLAASLRWLWTGGVTTVLAVVVILISFSDRSVEVGLYRTSPVRGSDAPLSPTDVPAARVIAFDQDAPFDQWKKDLSWNEHAKVWIDNENDLLHIIRRDKDGSLTEQTEPLARTNREQREQISRVVESLQKR